MPLQPVHRSILFRIIVIAIAVAIVAGCASAFYWLADWTQNFAEACEAASSRRKWNELGRTAESWSRWNPRDPEAWWYRALAAEGNGEWEQAAEFFDKIPPSSSRAPCAYLTRIALLFNRLHRAQDALSTCRRLVGINAHHCEARRWIIVINSALLRRAELVRQIRQAHAANCGSPETMIYLMRADLVAFGNAFELVSQFLLATPDDESCLIARAIMIAKGQIPDNAGFKAGDETEIETCLRRFPHNPEVLTFYLAKASQDGDLERVGELLQQFAPADQQDNGYWYYAGWRHFQLSELDEADEAYRRALEFYPFDTKTQHSLSELRRLQGRAPEVERWAQLAKHGLELKEALVHVLSPSTIPPELTEKIAAYAEDAGDTSLARLIRANFAQ